MSPSSHKILITGALHPEVIAALAEDSNYHITYHPDCSSSELIELVKSCDVLITRSETTVDSKLIDSASNLKIIIRAAVGVGNIDIDYATKRGILVINTPGKNTNSAAELTFGLMLSMLRNIPAAQSHLKSGGWDRHRFAGNELRGKRLGLIGLGHVGHRVAKFARGFDMTVFAFDPYLKDEIFRNHGVKRFTDLGLLVENSDVLSVHVPLDNNTRGMIGEDLLNKLPTGSYIVNAARGGIIDEQAIVDALASGRLAGAAIDTYENEPSPRKDLTQHPKVWCTQHIGASTEQAQFAIGRAVIDQLSKALSTGVVDYPINLPNVGVVKDPLLKAYSVLAQKLGSRPSQHC